MHFPSSEIIPMYMPVVRPVHAMLCESSVQEVMDLTPVAHLSAIKGRLPFINFFDGFRTSHEIQKIETWDYEDLKEMTDFDAIQAWRDQCSESEPSVSERFRSEPGYLLPGKRGNATRTMTLCRLSYRSTWTR